MHPIILFLFLLLLASTPLYSQPKNQQIPEEKIYEAILDTLQQLHEFGFYHATLVHRDTRSYAEGATDTFVVFDPNTFEEIKKLGIDLKIQEDSINLAEAKLYQQRIKHPDGLFLIEKIKADALHRYTYLPDYIGLKNYPDLQSMGTLDDAILNQNSIGKYQVRRHTASNRSRYKYAIKAFISFSGVQWNDKRSHCIVECGYHYRYKNKGSSGAGFHVMIKVKRNKIQIEKFIGLWQE
jgi:hypothetical protein